MERPNAVQQCDKDDDGNFIPPSQPEFVRCIEEVREPLEIFLSKECASQILAICKQHGVKPPGKKALKTMSQIRMGKFGEKFFFQVIDGEKKILLMQKL